MASPGIRGIDAAFLTEIGPVQAGAAHGFSDNERGIHKQQHKNRYGKENGEGCHKKVDRHVIFQSFVRKSGGPACIQLELRCAGSVFQMGAAVVPECFRSETNPDPVFEATDPDPS
jgi:hypothetical protein